MQGAGMGAWFQLGSGGEMRGAAGGKSRGKKLESRGSNCTALRCNFNLPSTLHCNVGLIAGIATDTPVIDGGGNWRAGWEWIGRQNWLAGVGRLAQFGLATSFELYF